MENKEKTKNDKLAIAESTSVTTNLSFVNHADFFSFCETIASSNLSPHKKPADVAIAILAGVSLGLPIVSALNNIHPVDGKATLGVHLVSGLLLKNDVLFEVTHHYEPMWNYYIFKKDDKGNVIKETKTKGNVSKEVPITISKILKFKDEKEEYEEQGKNIECFGTRIKFSRIFKRKDGSWSTIHHTETFTTLDAYNVLIKTNADGSEYRLIDKSNWQNYPKNMCFARTLINGARIIGSDFMLGFQTDMEMLDASNIDYRLNEQGEVVIDTDHKEES